jgi:hypothetical protein
MRGIFRLPIELYLEQLLPSWASSALAGLEKSCRARYQNDPWNQHFTAVGSKSLGEIGRVSTGSYCSKIKCTPL